MLISGARGPWRICGRWSGPQRSSGNSSVWPTMCAWDVGAPCRYSWRRTVHHTFPSLYHLTFRLAFGMVSHANEKQTSYALDIVLRHCRAVFDLHVANNLDI